MYWNVAREYRCTRNASGIKNLLARQGHYIRAHSVWHAIELMAAKFPDEASKDETWDAKETETPSRLGAATTVTKNFTVTLWR